LVDLFSNCNLYGSERSTLFENASTDKSIRQVFTEGSLLTTTTSISSFSMCPRLAVNLYCKKSRGGLPFRIAKGLVRGLGSYAIENEKIRVLSNLCTVRNCPCFPATDDTSIPISTVDYRISHISSSGNQSSYST
jgi:hypothetical protein